MPSGIPKGLVVFVSGIVIVAVLVWGYVSLFGAGSGGRVAGGNSFFSSLFPFGNTAAPSPTGSNGTSTPLGAPVQSGEVPLLREVSAAPVSGGWFGGVSNQGVPIIRYMLRESGHVEESPADSFAVNRISNTTLPGIEELIAASSSALILRDLGEDGAVRNFFARINATTSESSIALLPMPAFSRVAANGSHLLAVFPQSGDSEIDTANVDGGGRQALLSLPFAGLVPFIGGARNFVETAPSFAANGYVYEIRGGALEKIAGGFPGLMAIASPSGQYVAASWNTPAGFAMGIYDLTGGATYASPVGGLAPKCAWVPNREPFMFCAVPTDVPSGAYPDDWLMGNVSFSDEAWIVNPVGNASFFIGALTDQNGSGIDAENVSVDPSGTYALFMNKKDLSLWSLRIGEVVARTVP
jgi:hypothetical protein